VPSGHDKASDVALILSVLCGFEHEQAILLYTHTHTVKSDITDTQKRITKSNSMPTNNLATYGVQSRLKINLEEKS
jgi:hypothetical protein